MFVGYYDHDDFKKKDAGRYLPAPLFSMCRRILLIIKYVNPAFQQFLFLGTFVSQLGSCHDGKPALYITLFCARFFTEQVHVHISYLLILQAQEQIRSGHIGTCVALGSMYSVNQIPLAVVAYNDVGWAEITVAQLGVLWHAVQPCKQLVAQVFIQLFFGFKGADGLFLQLV